MAIQNDDTLVTKGDLKSMYADKIAPYLGGGINYYYTDRTGEELKSGQFALVLSTSHGSSTDATINANTIVPFIMQSGNFELGVTTGTFKVPNGMRIEVDVYTTVTNGTTTNCHWYLYNATDSKEIDVDNGTNLPGAYLFGGQASNYGMSQSATYQWTNNTGKTVEVGIRNMQSSCKVRVDSTGMTVKEIGRIVDPVKYVSNNSDLQETPVGNIISYMGNTVPKHYLACDGTVYNIGSYPELETFIINEFGSINYFGGDGTTNWAVPDLRGEFLRGTGATPYTDGGDGAAVGTHQAPTGINPGWTNNTTGGWSLPVAPSSTYSSIIVDNGDKYVNTGTRKSIIASTELKEKADTGSNAGYWTFRPTNTAVKYCIKYESTYHAFFSNATYKVEASFGLNYNSTLQSYVSYAMSYITGDSSLMDENYFIAPVDGWYMVSFKSNQISYTKPAVQYLQINDVTADAFTDATGSGTSHSNFGVNMTHTIYLSKGDKVNYRVWTNGNTITLPSVRSASFCLLTSNYNPTIVSADSVYSKNEQMIGYWEDGKPLYQKTYFATTPSSTVTGTNFITDSNLVNCDYITISSAVLKRSDGSECQTLPFHQDSNWANVFTRKASGYLTYAANFRGFDNVPIFVTIQYTKTTDTASTLQVENSLLLNRPDLWEVGTEYHFGGGLYGQRFTGTITSSNGNAYVLGSVSGVTKIVNTGGHVSDSNWHLEIGNYWGSNNYISNIAYQSATNSFRINHYGYINNAYDVWVLYKK